MQRRTMHALLSLINLQVIRVLPRCTIYYTGGEQTSEEVTNQEKIDKGGGR